MKSTFTLLLTLIGFLSGVLSQTYVVPPAYSTTASSGTFLGPLANGQRTYQLLINENQLTGLIGKNLTGFTFRVLPSASSPWPASAVTFNNYDVYLGRGVSPADRSLTFASNADGIQTQVRSGSLTIPAASFPAGGSPNGFGSIIGFTTPYLYSGGHLLVEIRHSGFTGTSTSVEAVTSSTAGFGTNFSACWTGNYTGTSGTNGNFSVTRFSFNDPLPLVLASFKVLRRLNDANLEWSTTSELNTQHFAIERSVDGRLFKTLGTVRSAGNATTIQFYTYTDRNIKDPGVTILYYRLKMVDKDGSFRYSAIVPLNISSNPAIVALYPNPVKDIASLTVNAAQKEEVIYSVITTEGKVVKTGSYQFITGNNLFSMDVSGLLSGNYYLHLRGKYTQLQFKFVKQ